MNLTKAEIMSLSQNKIGPCLKIENLQGLLKVIEKDKVFRYNLNSLKFFYII